MFFIQTTQIEAVRDYETGAALTFLRSGMYGIRETARQNRAPVGRVAGGWPTSRLRAAD
jgi:hypothetical protein